MQLSDGAFVHSRMCQALISIPIPQQTKSVGRNLQNSENLAASLISVGKIMLNGRKQNQGIRNRETFTF